MILTFPDAGSCGATGDSGGARSFTFGAGVASGISAPFGGTIGTSLLAATGVLVGSVFADASRRAGECAAPLLLLPSRVSAGERGDWIARSSSPVPLAGSFALATISPETTCGSSAGGTASAAAFCFMAGVARPLGLAKILISMSPGRMRLSQSLLTGGLRTTDSTTGVCFADTSIPGTSTPAPATRVCGR